MKEARREENKKNTTFLVLIGVALILILASIYHVRYTPEGKAKRAMTDLDNTATFSSTDVPQEDLENLNARTRIDGIRHNFEEITINEPTNMEYLGKVDMLNENGKTINTLDLYKSGDQYIFNLYGTYMKLENQDATQTGGLIPTGFLLSTLVS